MDEGAGSGRRWAITSRRVEPSRVEAVVDGHPLWVECDDVGLTDAAEAWGTAFAFPAARAGATLQFTQPIDRRWVEAIQPNLDLAVRWWGGDGTTAWSAPPSRLPEFVRRRWPRPGSGTALCFTGGVDSFFSLLEGAHEPTHLLYVVGFDVPLDDRRRVDDVTTLVRTVAEYRGLEAIIVRTDLRDHPRFASISWEHSHGAALAAIGHLLGSSISTLVIPPSYAAGRLIPWGSRPDLDPNWGRPGRLAIVHGDASGRRLDRVRAIASDPLVHAHLRVCWQNVGTDRNCGRCEKCVRTMAMLAGAGVLDECQTFPARSALPGCIDGLGVIPPGLIPLWTDLSELGLLPSEEAATARLVARSSGS